MHVEEIMAILMVYTALKLTHGKGVASDDFISYWPKDSIDCSEKNERKFTTIFNLSLNHPYSTDLKANWGACRGNSDDSNDSNCIEID